MFLVEHYQNVPLINPFVPVHPFSTPWKLSWKMEAATLAEDFPKYTNTKWENVLKSLMKKSYLPKRYYHNSRRKLNLLKLKLPDKIKGKSIKFGYLLGERCNNIHFKVKCFPKLIESGWHQENNQWKQNKYFHFNLI